MPCVHPGCVSTIAYSCGTRIVRGGNTTPDDARGGREVVGRLSDLKGRPGATATCIAVADAAAWATATWQKEQEEGRGRFGEASSHPVDFLDASTTPLERLLG